MRVSRMKWAVILACGACTLLGLLATGLRYGRTNMSDLGRIQRGMREEEIISWAGPAEAGVRSSEDPRCRRHLRFRERYRNSILNAISSGLSGGSGRFVWACVDESGTVLDVGWEVLHF